MTLDPKSTDSNVMLTFAATHFVIVPLQLAVIDLPNYIRLTRLYNAVRFTLFHSCAKKN